LSPAPDGLYGATPLRVVRQTSLSYMSTPERVQTKGLKNATDQMLGCPPPGRDARREALSHCPRDTRRLPPRPLPKGRADAVGSARRRIAQASLASQDIPWAADKDVVPRILLASVVVGLVLSMSVAAPLAAEHHHATSQAHHRGMFLGRANDHKLIVCRQALASSERVSLRHRPPKPCAQAVRRERNLGATPSRVSARGIQGSRVGFATNLRWRSEPEILSELRTVSAGGVGWIREDFSWAQNEPERGVFDWTRTDRLMAAAARARIRVLAIIDYSAPWASSDPSGHGDVLYPPSDPHDYARYAEAVVTRYGDKGTFWAERPNLPKVPLGAVELWNEPYGRWDWKPDPDPARYARLAHLAATAVHAVDPGMVVLASGDLLQCRTDGRIVGWVDHVLAADPGLAKEIDGWSVHPYPDPRNLGPYDTIHDRRFTFSVVPLVRAVTMAAGADLPIWITEIGWSTAPRVPGAVTNKQQADYITGAVRRALNDWGSFVPRIFLYTWDHANGVAGDREGNYGLLHSDGTPKPAWDALRTLILRRV